MANLDLDAIEKRANAATEEPWCDYDGDWYLGDDPHDPQETMHVTGVVVDPDVGRDTKCVLLSTCYDLEPELADCVFVGHARTDVPALVAELRKARKLLLSASVLISEMGMGPLDKAAKFGPDYESPSDEEIGRRFEQIMAYLDGTEASK